MTRFGIIALAFALPLAAGTILVSDAPTARLHNGAVLTADIRVSNYAAANPGTSPYPTAFNINVIFQAPEALKRRSLYSSSAAYYAGCAFEETLESLDGSVKIPLRDLAAESRGYREGYLPLTSGVYDTSGTGPVKVAILAASVHLTPEQAEALFGPGLAARILLRNIGSTVDAGIGNGYTVRNSILLSGLSGAGARSVGGIVDSASVASPEPSTWILGAGAGALLLLRALRARIAGAGKSQNSRA